MTRPEIAYDRTVHAVMDRVADGEYENRVPYPARDISEIDPETTTLAEAVRIKARRKQEFLASRTAYRQGEYAQRARLKADLEVEHDIVGHPKADKLWNLAWEMGHSLGYSGVLNYYNELLELVKP